MNTETQAPDPAPAKPFFAYDPENGVEWFETMQEAQAYAAESLREYRRSASFDGEWSGDVEAVKVGRVTHFLAEHGDDESGYDYRLVSAIPAPEGALRAAANAVLTRWNSPLWRQEVGTAELMAKLRAALAAPAPQAPTDNNSMGKPGCYPAGQKTTAVPQATVALTDTVLKEHAEHWHDHGDGPGAEVSRRKAALLAFKAGARLAESCHGIPAPQTKEQP